MKGNPFQKKIRDMIALTCGGGIFFSGISIYNNNEKFYSRFVIPVFHYFLPENSHKLALMCAKYNFLPVKHFSSKTLETHVLGHTFKSPIGLAAGFDKDCEAVDGLFKLGFAFVEVGSVTPIPQEGNPKPRLFRLTEDLGIINRYGFNSCGHDVFYKNLTNVTTNSKKGIIGVNLGSNRNSLDRISDYVKGLNQFGCCADYFVINISSPNTPGLKSCQKKDALNSLLSAVITAHNDLKCEVKASLLVKISPDLTLEEMNDIADIVLQHQIDGLIISNTTISRPFLKSMDKVEEGGLSGIPLKPLSTEAISVMARLTKGKIPIIGVGGIFDGKDAYEKIKAGASLLQIYSSLVYKGPPVVDLINRELDELLRKDGYSSLAEAVGVNSKTKVQ